MFYKETLVNSNTPEKLTQNFHRYLRERAVLHSEYYRRLMSEPNLKRHSSHENLPCQTENCVNSNVSDTRRFSDRPKVNIEPKLYGEEDIYCSSYSDCLLINKSSSGDKIKSSLRCLNETGGGRRRRSEEPLISYSRSKINSKDMLPATCGECLNDSASILKDQQQHLCDCSNNGVDCIKDQSRQYCCTCSTNSDVIGTSMLDVWGDDEENAIDRSSKYKQTVSCANSVTAVTNATDCGNHDYNANYNHNYDKENDAINNKNKMCDREKWDRSNYLTFVPARSLDRFDCATDLTRCNSKRRSSSISEDNEIEIARSGLTGGIYNTLKRSDPELTRCGFHADHSKGSRFLVCNDLYISNSSRFKSLIQRRKRALFERTFCKDYGIDGGVKDHFEVEITQNDLKKFTFPCVEKLVKMYTKLLEEKKNESIKISVDKNSKKMDIDENQLIESGEKDDSVKVKSDVNRGSPVSDEGCATGQSPCSSDNEETPPGGDTKKKLKEKVIRSSSSDSALGMEDEVSGGERSSSPTDSPPINTGRRMTLTVADIPLRPALLPLAEPTNLPDSPTPVDQQPTSSVGALLTQTAIPSKVLLEERVVEIPEDRFGGSLSNSRRESAQSCMSDYNSECGGVRYVRTPSVVVSDYSDDVMCGITLEEIEYFRQHRMRRRSSADTNATEKDDTASDVSASSSCSNLYYCGSTISALDGAEYYINGMRTSIDRKISDCSTCSTVSGDEDDDSFIVHEFQNQLKEQVQQQQNRKQKKVGEF